MTFSQIEQAAKKQNAWDAIGITFTDTNREYGVIHFTHRRTQPGCGTAEFRVDDGQISFHWGHYDMDPRTATCDFAERVRKCAPRDVPTPVAS